MSWRQRRRAMSISCSTKPNSPSGSIDFDRVIRYEESDLVRIGFPHIAEGSLFWYNADYPLYYFRHLMPEYDVVVTVEYDAVPNVDLDDLVRRFRAENLDLVGRTIEQDAGDLLVDQNHAALLSHGAGQALSDLRDHSIGAGHRPSGRHAQASWRHRRDRAS